jgi:hypothetical protein
MKINAYPIVTLASYAMVGQAEQAKPESEADNTNNNVVDILNGNLTTQSASDTDTTIVEQEQPEIQPKTRKHPAPALVPAPVIVPAPVDTPKTEPQAENAAAPDNGFVLRKEGNGYVMTLNESAVKKVLSDNNIAVNKAEDLTWLELVKAIAAVNGKKIDGDDAQVKADIKKLAGILKADNGCEVPIFVLKKAPMPFGEIVTSILPHFSFSFNQYASYLHFVHSRAIPGKYGSFPREMDIKISGEAFDMISNLPDQNTEAPAPEPVQPVKAAPAARTTEIHETKVKVHISRPAAEEEEEAPGPANTMY